MKPFFTFYGGKYRIALKYPKPQYQTIIEPFCGSAGYSLRYAHLNIILYEIDPRIYGVWNYLINVKESEILNLDQPICQEQEWLIGFWLNKGSAQPAKQPSKWMRDYEKPNSCNFWGECVKTRIASQLHGIRHWKIYNKSYLESSRIEATWFIDPPYNNKAGRCYKYHDINYKDLGSWCQELGGQVMVCENEGADWLPFKPFLNIHTTNGKMRNGYSKEVIWLNSKD